MNMYACPVTLLCVALPSVTRVGVGVGVCRREPKLFGAIEAVVRYAGASRRAGDLYAGRSILSKARNAFKGLQVSRTGEEGHQPAVATLVVSVPVFMRRAVRSYMFS